MYKMAQAIQLALTQHYDKYPEAEVFEITVCEAANKQGTFFVKIYAEHFSVPLEYNIAC